MDPTSDASQWAAAATQITHGVAGLTPIAQVTAVVVIGIVAVVLLLRPAILALATRGEIKDDTIALMVQAISEQARATNQLSERLEATLEKILKFASAHSRESA